VKREHLSSVPAKRRPCRIHHTTPRWPAQQNSPPCSCGAPHTGHPATTPKHLPPSLSTSTKQTYNQKLSTAARRTECILPNNICHITILTHPVAAILSSPLALHLSSMDTLPQSPKNHPQQHTNPKSLPDLGVLAVTPLRRVFRKSEIRNQKLLRPSRPSRPSVRSPAPDSAL